MRTSASLLLAISTVSAAAAAIAQDAVLLPTTLDLRLPAKEPVHFDVLTESPSGIHLAWTDAQPPPGLLHYGRLHREPAHWTWEAVPALGGDQAPLGDFAVLGMAGGVLAAVWQTPGNGTNDLDVAYATLAPSGETWTRPAILHDDPARQALPQFACSADACDAVWQEETVPGRGDWFVVGARILPQPGPRQRLSDNPADTKGSFPKALALPDGRALVAWTDERNSTAPQIRAALWSPAAGTVAASQSLTDPARRANMSALTLGRAETLLAAWADSPNATSKAIHWTTSGNPGSWTPAADTALTVPGSRVQHLAAFAWPDGRAGLAWEDSRGGLPRLRVAGWDGTRWSDGVAADAKPGASHSFPTPLVLDGELYVVYVEKSDAGARIVVSTTAAAAPVIEPSPTPTYRPPIPGVGAWGIVAALGLGLAFVRRP